jgi:hypothetical protein
MLLLPINTLKAMRINWRFVVLGKTYVDCYAFDGKDLHWRLITLDVAEEFTAAFVPGLKFSKIPPKIQIDYFFIWWHISDR